MKRRGYRGGSVDAPFLVLVCSPPLLKAQSFSALLRNPEVKHEMVEVKSENSTKVRNY